ncbi:MAG: Inositol-1-monophosphatase [Candidatus Magasanikbacteria bacterium GW2011_GWA2_37_8]|uniref:Inositol-1-monophosphatase n=1 Tax=Candidatus Magasanikbacteria bacterium GW2011_GWA2_37_8 TaxID=1619036 RepID=A0A0G0KL72_9BACT|nr:MAG: Inositol-1-monophosphatase [Candidatus Magasanikbacteria bacterium GW2011_GWA2_37_8]
MEQLYSQIIDYVVKSGKRINQRAGKIKDIGITKQYLTEEDIAIERGIKNLVNKFNPNHTFYAEEENFDFNKARDVWICNPISGTRTFINGLAHYGMAVAHMHNGKVVFSVVYDPSMNQLFTAYKGKGAFLNGERLKIKLVKNNPKVLFHLSIMWKDSGKSQKMFELLTKFELYRNWNSQALSYCHLAKGIYNGLIIFSKDSFPDFAGSLIVKEAGGIFTNLNGEKDIKPSDRVFIAGDKKTYGELKQMVDKIFS